jgi:hypothetical protein
MATPSETILVSYTLSRTSALSVSGRLVRLPEEDLSEIPGKSLEVVEEPVERRPSPV